MVQAVAKELLANGVGNPYAQFLTASHRICLGHPIFVRDEINRALNPLRLDLGPL